MLARTWEWNGLRRVMSLWRCAATKSWTVCGRDTSQAAVSFLTYIAHLLVSLLLAKYPFKPLSKHPSKHLSKLEQPQILPSNSKLKVLPLNHTRRFYISRKKIKNQWNKKKKKKTKETNEIKRRSRSDARDDAIKIWSRRYHLKARACPSVELPINASKSQLKKEETRN